MVINYPPDPMDDSRRFFKVYFLKNSGIIQTMI